VVTTHLALLELPVFVEDEHADGLEVEVLVEDVPALECFDPPIGRRLVREDGQDNLLGTHAADSFRATASKFKF
jgi:hypothetical protein